MEILAEQEYKNWAEQAGFVDGKNIADYVDSLNIDVLKYLVEVKSINIFTPNQNKRNLLAEVAKAGNLEMVQYLAEKYSFCAESSRQTALNSKNFVVGWF